MREGTKGAGPERTTWLLALVALGAVVAVIVLGLQVLERSAGPGDGDGRSAASADPAAPELRALAQEIVALRAELAQLRLALAGAPATPAGGEPVSLAPPPTDPATMMSLVAALDRLSAQLGARLPALEAPARNLERREELRVLLEPEQEDWSDEARDAWDAEFEAGKQRYFFLTEQQVLDTYGRPDVAYARDDGGWTWEYQFSERESVTFRFANGRVIDVWN